MFVHEGAANQILLGMGRPAIGGLVLVIHNEFFVWYLPQEYQDLLLCIKAKTTTPRQLSGMRSSQAEKSSGKYNLLELIDLILKVA